MNNKGTGKRTQSNSGKNDGKSLLREVGSAARSNLRKSLGALSANSGTSLLERDRAARRCRNLRDELESRIKQLGKQVLLSPEEIPYSNQEFEQVMEKEAKQRKDRVIWKAYSKHGGICDILTDIRNGVERPSSNAFDFDEEEGAYIIFITLNNTYISRMAALCSEMCSECGQIENGKMESSELQKEREMLQKVYDELCSKKERLSKKLFSKEWKEALDSKQEKTLLKLKMELDSYEESRKDYDDNIEAYREQLGCFMEECEQQKSYVPRYDTLLEELTKLGEISRENHPFYILTISPKEETELEQYMETAREFSKWTLHITEEYSL